MRKVATLLTLRSTKNQRKMKQTEIRRCCASCRHKQINEEGTRVCAVMGHSVKKGFKCRQWQLSEELKTWLEATSNNQYKIKS